MNELTNRERELVALGAALGSNCVPCIEYHVPEARKAGLTDQQIGEAIQLADKVRQVPARKVLDTALGLIGKSPAAAGTEGRASGCSQPTSGFAPPQGCCG